MKSLGRHIVIVASWFVVRSLLRKHDLKIVAITGSVGKTSTKRAIATVLGKKYKVQWQDGNYNDIVSVPLVFFGLEMPSLTSPFAWIKTLRSMWDQIKDYPYDLIILELGTDAPGQISKFGKYLKADLAVVTPIAPEHMEFFQTLDKVAKEELGVQDFASTLVVNEHTASAFGSELKNPAKTYGLNSNSDAYLLANGQEVTIKTKAYEYTFVSRLLGEHQISNLVAACLVAEIMGLDKVSIETGLGEVDSGAGRMHKLDGIKNSIIIDDTYNSSPKAAKAALDALKKMPGTQKIAVLGNMNELGGMSKQLHEELGDYCDPVALDLVITIGADANKYLAEAARAKGCTVRKADTPYQVGEILKDVMEDHATILLKGSQNGVFLEETVKMILANPDDASKLARQNPQWIAKKKKLLGQ